MKNKTYLFLYIIIAAAPIFASETTELSDFISNTDSFQILASNIIEPCDICVVQQLKKAFELLNSELKPGKIILTSQTCLFEKTELININELKASCYSDDAMPTGYPILTFRFHTEEAKLVGISSSDLTEKQIASEYHSHHNGLFEGKIQIVEFKYGVGAGFHYLPKSHHLQIHCKLLDLKRIVP